MNVKSTANKRALSTHKSVPTAEEWRQLKFNKWLRLHRKGVNDKALDRLWELGHKFDSQPKVA